jgi:hypothetical protein
VERPNRIYVRLQHNQNGDSGSVTCQGIEANQWLWLEVLCQWLKPVPQGLTKRKMEIETKYIEEKEICRKEQTGRAEPIGRDRTQ